MEATKKMTRQEFEKKLSCFKRADDLHYFLMNVLSLLTYNSYYYCECEKFEGPSAEWEGPQNVLFAGYHMILPTLKNYWTYIC